MTSLLQSVAIGIRQSFHPSGRKWIFLIGSLLSMAALFILPVVTTPGNSFAFQFSIMRWSDIIILISLSFLVGLVIVLQIENWRCCRACKASTLSALSQGGSSTVAVGGTALLATAACSSCLAGVLGIFGLGAFALTLLDYRIYVMTALLLLTGISVIYTAHKIGSGACRVPSPSPR